MNLQAAGNCITQDAWICPKYLRRDSGVITDSLIQHIKLSAFALAIALLLAIPLAALALRSAWLHSAILATLGIVYTIPSLALFVLLQPVFGITHATPVIIALVAYAQLLLVRNIVVGLEEVPPDAVEAARGLGYTPARLMTRVRLPLALPAILAGLRVTAVSTISLLTIGGLIAQGGLGQLLYDGFQNEHNYQVLTAVVLIVLLGLAADLLILGLQRVVTPWERARR